MTASRRGFILPVVLLVLMLLGLMGAMFAFRVNADLATTQAMAYRLQTRLAAETGIDRVKQILRESRFDMDRWYHNMEELHRVLVWVEDGDQSVWGSNDEFQGDVLAYRFSIVADDPTDDEDLIRIGLTDEASKVNLNTATEGQLLKLVRAAVGGESEEINPQDIVDAILDWRDSDSTPRGESGDTEGSFYRKLTQPYQVKNGPFDTVEELLLVKGVTGQILYGEDWDRNGLLTPNEDDGDLSFPPDNEDGVLNRGLYPYLTTFSKESNVSNSNRPRVFLLGEQEQVRAELTAIFPDEPQVVDFIVMATRPQQQRRQPAGGRRRPPRGGPTQGTRRGSGTLGWRADQPQDEGNDPNAAAGTEDGQPGGAPEEQSGPIQTPASLLRDRIGGQQVTRSPLGIEHLPVLMDQTTTVPQRDIPGLININTAPRLVLECIDGLTSEQIDAILEARQRISQDRKMTTAWLVLEEVVDLETFERIAPQITARAQQFTIEALGYGDHVGMVTRLQAVVDMTGPIAQTVYYRDLTYLAGHYPIREEDLEVIRGR